MVEQARMAAQMAAEARAEVQAKVALAQERKALLEAESQARATARAQEHARLARLNDEVKAQQARDRAQRLAEIEAARADLAAAQLEEDARLKAQAVSDAERRRRETQQRNAQRIERERSKASKQRRPPPNPDSVDGSEAGSSSSPTPSRVPRRLSTQRLSQEELDRIAPLDKRSRIEEEEEEMDDHDHEHEDEEEKQSEDSVGKPRRSRAVRDAERAMIEAARQRDASPKRLPPPPPAFDVVRNHSPQGILPHIFDLFTVADAPAISIDHALRDVLQASAAAAQPLTPGAILPLTILFDGDSHPVATFHTDPHGCIRRNVWDALDARSVFVKFERNVALQRQAMAASTAAGGGSHGKLAIVAHPEEELAATLLVLDGSLPPLSLTLLDVGVLLKNGVGACRVIPKAYASTVEGFIVQNFVFPAIEKPASIAAHLTATKAPIHLPHYTVYRCDFSSASHFDVQRRTNKFTLWPPAGAAQSAGGIVSPHARIVGFKCPPGGGGADKLTTAVSIVSKGTDPHSQDDRDMVSQLRRVCVSILKKVNEKCRSEEGEHTTQRQHAEKVGVICERGCDRSLTCLAGSLSRLSRFFCVPVVVQRLCLYFTAELGGAVHLLYGDRIDLRLQHQPAPATSASAPSASSFSPSSTAAVPSTSVSGLAGRVRQLDVMPRVRSTPALAPIKQPGQQWQQ